MEDIRRSIKKAVSVLVYRDGAVHEFSAGSKEFALLLSVWERMTEKALPMPAFGVSIDDLTRRERSAGVWVEFCFDRERECDGMPFEKLLVKVLPEYCGFNLIRCCGGAYTGRCFYLDLQDGSMQELYSAALSLA